MTTNNDNQRAEAQIELPPLPAHPDTAGGMRWSAMEKGAIAEYTRQAIAIAIAHDRQQRDTWPTDWAEQLKGEYQQGLQDGRRQRGNAEPAVVGPDDATINSITLDTLGRWPTVAIQFWACKVVHAVFASYIKQPAEPVKEPSDKQLAEFYDSQKWPTPEAYSRALLDRYQGAQPAVKLPARRSAPMRADEGVAPLEFNNGWNQCLEAVEKLNQGAQPANVEPVDKGLWYPGITEDGKRHFVQSEDFTHDVRLYVDGDFAEESDKRLYVESIATQLNAPQPAASAEPIGILECSLSGSTFWPDASKVLELPVGEHSLYTAPVAAQPSVPDEPDPALLISMATCLNHGFGLLDKQRQESMLYDMRKLWDEVVGRGYYSPTNRDRYTAMLAAAPTPPADEQAQQSGGKS